MRPTKRTKTKMRFEPLVVVLLLSLASVALGDDPHCCAPASFSFRIESFTNVAGSPFPFDPLILASSFGSFDSAHRNGTNEGIRRLLTPTGAPNAQIGNGYYDEQQGSYALVMFGNDTYQVYSLPVRTRTSHAVGADGHSSLVCGAYAATWWPSGADGGLCGQHN
jgi:hypothetical protein